MEAQTINTQNQNTLQITEGNDLPIKDSNLSLYIIAVYLILGIHLNFSNTGGTGLELPYNAFGWVFISLILSSGLNHIAITKVWFKDKALLLVAVIMLTISLPMALQESLTPSLAGTRVIGLFAGLFITVIMLQCFQRKKSWQQIISVIAFAGLVESIICLIQQFLPSIAELAVYKTDYGRPFGSFQQPNVSASFIATGLACSLYLTLHTPPQTKQSFTRQLHRSFTPLASCFALILLSSRTGMLATLMIFIMTLPVFIQSVRTQKLKSNALPWLSFALFGVFLGLSSLSKMENSGRALESIQSTHNRQGIYKQAFDMINEKPLSGWGYGNFESSFLNYYAEQTSTGEYQHPVVNNLDHPHNELLLWAIEGGVIPSLLLISLAILLIVRTIKQLGWSQGLLALSLCMPLALHANTEYPFYQSIAHWFLFSLIVAWLIWLTSSKNQGSIKRDFFIRCFAWIIPLIVIPIMLLNLQAIHKVTQFHANHAKDFNYLSKVKHPSGIWKRFFFDVMTYRLIQGLEQRDTLQITAYIDWAETFVTHTPRKAIYFNLANAYWALSKQEIAVEKLQRAAFLYPNDDKVQQAFIKTRNKWQEIQQTQKSSH